MRTIVLCWSAAIVGLWVLLLAGCSTVPEYPKVDLSKNYRMEADLEINGQRGFGFVMVPDTPELKIRIRTADDVNLLIAKTCHREVSINKQSDRFDLTWTVRDIERDRYCPAQFYGVSTKGFFVLGGYHLQSGTYGLPFTQKCNGEEARASGTGFCQARSGLLQAISFDQPVRAASNDCGMVLETSDNRTFQYEIRPGFCLQLFRDVATGKMTRLISYGYELFLFDKG